jgi:hypothetical protein
MTDATYAVGEVFSWVRAILGGRCQSVGPGA